MDIKYYKDLSHNYLIIKENADSDNKYQNKMICGNQIKHFLPCSIRRINNETYFYYEISSKQSIKSFYEREKIGYRQLFYLFRHIYEAAEKAREYLLEDSRLLLSPEYIYLNPEEEQFFFVYFPCNWEDDMTVMSFAEFLLERVNREEENAVEIIYKIYERAQDNNFMLPDILQFFDEALVKEPEIAEEVSLAEDEWDCQEYAENIEQEEAEEESGGKGRMIISAVLLALCIGAAGSIFCIRYLFVLSAEEQLLSIAGIIMLIMISSLLLLYLLLIAIPEKKNLPEKSEVLERQVFDYDLSPANSLMKQRDGNTVFVEASLYQRENKLYGMNKGNKYHIDMNSLPCTIGKLAGGVDCVIRDETVSRIHARLSKEGQEICVTDLNSTNGTFKNGLRLEPNETVAIEPGDEIRFGRMTFCYR